MQELSTITLQSQATFNCWNINLCNLSIMLTTYDLYNWMSVQQDSRLYNFCLKLLFDAQWPGLPSCTSCYSMWGSWYKNNPQNLPNQYILRSTLIVFIIIQNITKPLSFMIGLMCYHTAWILITFCPTLLILYEQISLRYHHFGVCSTLYLASLNSFQTNSQISYNY